MQLPSGNKSRQFGDFIDCFILLIIGLFSMGYSWKFPRTFAQMHINLPFLNFPIFIGEMLLFLCLVLLVIKFILSRHKFIFTANRIYLALVSIFCLFFIFKVFLGFINYGPLALRNAALFYYPSFAFITYMVYNRKFFNELSVTVTVILLSSLIIIRQFNCYYYFMFTYLALAIFLTLKIKSRLLKTLILLSLLIFSPYQYVFFNARANLFGSIAALMVLFISFVLNFKFKQTRELFFLVLILLIAVVSAYTFSDKTKLKGLAKLTGIVSQVKAIDRDFADRGRSFDFKNIPVKVYEEDNNSSDQGSPAKTISIKSDLIRSFSKIKSHNEVVDPKPIVASSVNGQPVLKKKIEAEKTVTDKSIDLKAVAVSSVKDRDVLEERDGIVQASNVSSEAKTIIPASSNESLNNILWRVLAARDMLRELWQVNPIFGVGFGKPFRSRTIEFLGWNKNEIKSVGWIEPHNSYVHILYRAGFIGLLVILFVIHFILRALHALVIGKDVSGFLLISILAYWLVAANFMVLFELPFFAIPFWSLFGLIMAYSGLGRK